jgi:tRNA pseudouridine55 synthase
MSKVASPNVDGILLLDKPFGLSSAAAVARIKRHFGARKAGHTGSLDPLATGMLPICLGEATKFGGSLLESDKLYRVTARLGERTPTADRETAVIETRDTSQLNAASLVQALAHFPRDYWQVPPMHSAIKQGGKPLYEYARAGESRDRAARRLRIQDLVFRSWNAPELCFEVSCSKGTYVRVLVEDIARQADNIAHLAALRRLAVAPFHELDMVSWAEIEAWPHGHFEPNRLLPPDAALASWPRVAVSHADLPSLLRGQTLQLAAGVAPGPVRLYAPDGRFLGAGELGARGALAPKRLIANPTDRA